MKLKQEMGIFRSASRRCGSPYVRQIVTTVYKYIYIIIYLNWKWVFTRLQWY
jgi:hypothetical protein